MSTLNAQVIEKLIEAKRLEKEAFMMLLPEKMQKHLEVIGNEVKAMLLDYILDVNEEEKSPKVKKVDIG